MKRTSLIRLGGLATMVGGVFFLAFPLLLGYVLVALTPPVFYLVVEGLLVLVVVALLLVPVGMVGFHALQGHSYGWIGRVGFGTVAIASLVVAYGVVDFFMWGDVLQEEPPVWLGWGVWGLVVGFALYGVATLQAGVLPRWCGVVFIVALPVALAVALPVALALGGPRPFSWMFGVSGVAWVALGYVLWSRRAASAAGRPSRVR